MDGLFLDVLAFLMVASSPLSSRSASWKWWITGLLLLATTINYMDRVTLSSASVRVTTEFGLNDQQYGHLELAFGWAFAAGSLVFGFLADRWRVFWLYPAVLAAITRDDLRAAHRRVIDILKPNSPGLCRGQGFVL